MQTLKELIDEAEMVLGCVNIEPDLRLIKGFSDYDERKEDTDLRLFKYEC